MTVMSIYAPVNRMGNGATLIFDFPYQFFAPTDLVVTLLDLTANAPVVPPPALNGSGTFGYTVTGTVDVLGTGEYLNGSVTFNTAPPSNVQVTIARHIAPFQPVALADDSLFPAKTVEAEFDRLQMQIQQNTEGLGRAITVPASDPPLNLELPPASVRGNKMFAFNAAGAPDVAISRTDVINTIAAVAAGQSGAPLPAWPIIVDQYGFAPGNSAAANTAALQTACTFLQNRGGGFLVIVAPGTYNILAPIGGTLFSFSNLKGVSILAMDGVVLNDQTVYTGSQAADLFDFVACQNIAVRLKVSSQIAVAAGSLTACGLWAMTLLQGCAGIDVDLDLTGCIGGLRPSRLASDPVSYVSRTIRGKIRASGTYYPYCSQYGSDDVTLQINATMCGRPFYLYGSRGQRLDVMTKDVQVQAIIGAFMGFGNEDVFVRYFDRDSSINKPASPRLYLHWGDTTPATHRNIHLHVNFKNPSASPWGNTIGVCKFSDGGTTADSTGRGHMLDGLELTGEMEGVAGVNHFNVDAGGFATPDVVRNIFVHDLTLIGASSAFSMTMLNVLSGVARFVCVSAQHNLYALNGTNGLVLFDGCTAANFTSGPSAVDVHEYRTCIVTSGGNQSFEIAKNYNGKGLFYGAWKNGFHVVRAEQTLTGDLTGTNTLFKVPALGTGLTGRIAYHLCADISDFSAATRKETRGAKSFSATINGAGIWIPQLAFADEVTERVQNLASAVTFSLVSGDATGGFIKVACTNYNNVKANGVFAIEILGMGDKTAVTGYSQL